MMIRLFASACLLLSQYAYAYPAYISYGYTNCRTCHFHPLGNGPLTDYGRALSATVLSGKLTDTSDDDLAKSSGFLGPLGSLPSFLSLQTSYRGLYLATGLERTAIKRWINMQAEGSVVLKDPKERFMALATLGYAPTPASTAPSLRATVSNLISRRHYVAVRASENLGIYFGFMDQAFGIQSVDHNAYYRSRTFLNMNDQTHGLLLHTGGKSWDGAVHLVMGNLFQDPTVRQKGASLYTEFDVADRVRLGASLLATTGSVRSRQMFAVHVRAGMSEGSSVLAELGVARELPASSPTLLGSFFFLQSMNRMARGLYWLATFEQYAEDFTRAGARYYRAGPGLLYAPMQRVELRLDFQATRTFGLSVVGEDIYTVLAQGHVYL